jgi:hypothetical protein
MKGAHRIVATIGIVVVLLIASYGCGGGKPPEEEQKAAQQAMEQAKKVQAEKLAIVDWGQASQSLADADKSLKINRYGDARMFYTRAKSRFENTYKVAKAKYDSLLREADENQTQINKHYGIVKTQLTSSRVPAKVKKELEGTCAEYEKSIEEINNFRSNGDAIRAKLNSQDLLKKIYDTEKSLETKK